LLRVLEQHEVTPVGDARPLKSDFRAIAATNRDLLRHSQGEPFRQDLYFRLAVFEIHLPPLRERVEDVPLLAERFLARLAPPGERALRFTADALAELCRRPWPGNVRELRSAVEHGALLARSGAVGKEHLPPVTQLDAGDPAAGSSALDDAVRKWAADELAAGRSAGNMYEQFLAQAEPPLFETVLANTLQNRAAAADLLGIHRATLRKKLG
jgi:two-component system nitrogen regulation response regulator GlnG